MYHFTIMPLLASDMSFEASRTELDRLFQATIIGIIATSRYQNRHKADSSPRQWSPDDVELLKDHIKTCRFNWLLLVRKMNIDVHCLRPFTPRECLEKAFEQNLVQNVESEFAGAIEKANELVTRYSNRKKIEDANYWMENLPSNKAYFDMDTYALAAAVSLYPKQVSAGTTISEYVAERLPGTKHYGPEQCLRAAITKGLIDQVSLEDSYDGHLLSTCDEFELPPEKSQLLKDAVEYWNKYSEQRWTMISNYLNLYRSKKSVWTEENIIECFDRDFSLPVIAEISLIYCPHDNPKDHHARHDNFIKRFVCEEFSEAAYSEFGKLLEDVFNSNPDIGNMLRPKSDETGVIVSLASYIVAKFYPSKWADMCLAAHSLVVGILSQIRSFTACQMANERDLPVVYPPCWTSKIFSLENAIGLSEITHVIMGIDPNQADNASGFAFSMTRPCDTPQPWKTGMEHYGFSPKVDFYDSVYIQANLIENGIAMVNMIRTIFKGSNAGSGNDFFPVWGEYNNAWLAARRALSTAPENHLSILIFQHPNAEWAFGSYAGAALDTLGKLSPCVCLHPTHMKKDKVDDINKMKEFCSTIVKFPDMIV
jgi:hypothetical protein